MGKNKDIVRALSSFSQVSLSVISPIIACLIIGKFLVDKFGLPNYVVAVFIGLGAISVLYSMFKFLMNITKSK